MYEATYTVPGDTATGEARRAVCHPSDLAVGNVTLASSLPFAVQSWPSWTPWLAAYR